MSRIFPIALYACVTLILLLCAHNALLLLKNLTRGQKKAVFTYNKGKQIFW